MLYDLSKMRDNKSSKWNSEQEQFLCCKDGPSFTRRISSPMFQEAKAENAVQNFTDQFRQQYVELLAEVKITRNRETDSFNLLQSCGIKKEFIMKLSSK